MRETDDAGKPNTNRTRSYALVARVLWKVWVRNGERQWRQHSGGAALREIDDADKPNTNPPRSYALVARVLWKDWDRNGEHQ